jgi:hypothetical protein
VLLAAITAELLTAAMGDGLSQADSRLLHCFRWDRWR